MGKETQRTGGTGAPGGRRGRCNCAQAVLKAFEDKLPVDADTLMKLGAGYAAGMGCMEAPAVHSSAQ